MTQEANQTRRRLARRHFIGGGFATLALAGAGLSRCHEQNERRVTPIYDGRPAVSSRLRLEAGSYADA